MPKLCIKTTINKIGQPWSSQDPFSLCLSSTGTRPAARAAGHAVLQSSRPSRSNGVLCRASQAVPVTGDSKQIKSSLLPDIDCRLFSRAARSAPLRHCRLFFPACASRLSVGVCAGPRVGRIVGGANLTKSFWWLARYLAQVSGCRET